MTRAWEITTPTTSEFGSAASSSPQRQHGPLEGSSRAECTSGAEYGVLTPRASGAGLSAVLGTREFAGGVASLTGKAEWSSLWPLAEDPDSATRRSVITSCNDMTRSPGRALRPSHRQVSPRKKTGPCETAGEPGCDSVPPIDLPPRLKDEAGRLRTGPDTAGIVSA